MDWVRDARVTLSPVTGVIAGSDAVLVARFELQLPDGSWAGYLPADVRFQVRRGAAAIREYPLDSPVVRASGADVQAAVPIDGDGQWKVRVAATMPVRGQLVVRSAETEFVSAASGF